MPILEIPEPGSLSLTCDIFPYESDTRVASGLALTEATNRKGWYTATISGFTGWHTAHVYLGTTIIDVAFLDVEGTGFIKANPADFKSNWQVNSLPSFAPGSAGYTLANISGAASDKTGYSLSAGGIQAIWDYSTSLMTTAGSIGRAIVDISNKIGPFIGSGLNTVFGFLRAEMISASSIVPSQVGGTYDNTTDSLEAIRDRGDAAWASSSSLTASGVWNYATRTLTSLAGNGVGANYVYLTVTNLLSSGLTDASVSTFQNGVLAGVNTTNISGVANFNLNNGNYTVAITLPSYSFAGDSLTVLGTTTDTYQMTPMTVNASADPLKSAILVVCYGPDTLPEEDVLVLIKQIGIPNGDTGHTFDGEATEYRSDSNGQITATLWRNVAYKYRRGTGGSTWQTFTPDSASYLITSIYGEN